MVMMWSRRRALIRSISAARVEVLPQPVGPVSSTRPCRRSVSWARRGGRWSVSSEGICAGKQADAGGEGSALVVEVGAEPAHRAANEAEIQGLVSVSVLRTAQR